MFSRGEHDGLVSRLYASAMGEAPWTDTLGHATSLFKASTAVMAVYDAARRVVAWENFGYSPAFAADFFASETYANDPRVPYFANVSPGAVYFDHMLYDVEAMNQDPACRASCEALGVKYQLGAILDLPHGLTVGLALLSSEAQGQASEAAIAAFRQLTPHATQACALGHVFERQATTRAALLRALECKADGIVLLSPSGEATFVNDVACAVLASGDGLTLRGADFRTHRPPETRRLRQLVAKVLGSDPDAAAGGRALVSRPSGKPPYVITVLGAPATDAFLSRQAIGCVVHIHDLAVTAPPAHEALRAVFGLSEREADFAIELVRCASLERAAANAGMAVNTARNHLQSISRKTGAVGQTAIVQRLGRFA